MYLEPSCVPWIYFPLTWLQRDNFRVMLLWLCVFLMVTSPLAAQVTRPKDVRELAKGGSDAIPQLQPLLKNADLEIRIQAGKTIVDIGTQRSIDPRIEATRDADPAIQSTDADILVNH